MNDARTEPFSPHMPVSFPSADFCFFYAAAFYFHLQNLLHTQTAHSYVAPLQPDVSNAPTISEDHLWLFLPSVHHRTLLPHLLHNHIIHFHTQTALHYKTVLIFLNLAKHHILLL